MVPDQLRFVPIFVKFTQWHLLGHYHAYVLVKLAAAAQLFLMRQYFLTIPKDLEEAAKLDGAGTAAALPRAPAGRAHRPAARGRQIGRAHV